MRDAFSPHSSLPLCLFMSSTLFHPLTCMQTRVTSLFWKCKEEKVQIFVLKHREDKQVDFATGAKEVKKKKPLLQQKIIQ